MRVAYQRKRSLVPAGGVRHVLGVTGASADPDAVESIATRLAEVHGAELTLLYALSPLRSPVPTGGEAIAQHEELRQAASGLRKRLAVARRRDVPARPSLREGERTRAVTDELRRGPGADIVVTGAATARSRLDVVSGRGIERLARRVSPPVLGIHSGDELDLRGALRIAVVHWTRDGGVEAAERVRALFTTEHGAPVVSLVRVGAGRRGDDPTPDGDVTADIPPVAGGDRQASGPVVNELDEAVRMLREREIDAIASARLEPPGEDRCAEIRALDVDVVALAADAPRRRWPRRGALGRISPRLERPVLAL